MTDTTKLEKQVVNATGFLGVVSKFVQRLGDPSKWEYRDECIDLGAPTGKCTCDHPIRYVFPIYNPETKAMAPCGSECIKHFHTYNPELYDRLQKAVEGLERRLADAKSEALRAHRMAEAEKVKPEYDAEVERGKRVVAEWKDRNPGKFWMPYELYTLTGILNKGVPEYKVAASYAKFYIRKAAEIKKLIETYYKNNPAVAQQPQAITQVQAFDPHKVVPF